jgi:hypothetical protein
VRAPSRHNPGEYDPETPSYVVPSLEVYPPDDEPATGTLLGPDGEPLIVFVPARFPIGFCAPTTPEDK